MAIKFLKRSSAIYPTLSPLLLLEIGAIAQRNSNRDELGNVYRQLTQFNQKQIDVDGLYKNFFEDYALSILALLADKEKAFPLFESLYNAKSELLFNTPTLLFQAAECFFRQKAFKKALSAYQALIKRFPKHFPNHDFAHLRLLLSFPSYSSSLQSSSPFYEFYTYFQDLHRILNNQSSLSKKDIEQKASSLLSSNPHLSWTNPQLISLQNQVVLKQAYFYYQQGHYIQALESIYSCKYVACETEQRLSFLQSVYTLKSFPFLSPYIIPNLNIILFLILLLKLIKFSP